MRSRLLDKNREKTDCARWQLEKHICYSSGFSAISENAVEDEDEAIVLWILKWIVSVILICYLGGWLHRPYKNLSEKWSQ